MYGARAKALLHFWQHWSESYLKTLPPLVSRFRTRGAPPVGSLVLIKDNNLPRLKWPLGVVSEVFRGRDGLIRAVKVKTAVGLLTRAIQNLYDLEIAHDVTQMPQSMNDDVPRAQTAPPPVTDPPDNGRLYRPRREIRPPRRYRDENY